MVSVQNGKGIVLLASFPSVSRKGCPCVGVICPGVFWSCLAVSFPNELRIADISLISSLCWRAQWVA